jgi:predicted HNH restriction endonuclease
VAKKNSRRKPNTPRSRIKNTLRRLWLQSRERAAALKQYQYKCAECGIKQSMAKGRVVKLQVHHNPAIGGKWEQIIDLIIKDILCSLQVPLCEECHKKVHDEKTR